jgi:hypothetical protein
MGGFNLLFLVRPLLCPAVHGVMQLESVIIDVRETVFSDVAYCTVIEITTKLHGAASQKTVIFMLISVRM